MSGKKYSGGTNRSSSFKINKAEPSDDREVVKLLSDLLTLEYAYPLIEVKVEANGNTYQWVSGVQNDANNWVDKITVLQGNVAAISSGEGTAFATRALAVASPEADGNPFVVYGDPGFNGQYRFDSTNVDDYVAVKLFKEDTDNVNATDQTQLAQIAAVKTEQVARVAAELELLGGIITPTISFVNGAISSTDGSEITTTAQKRTGFIDIQSASTINYYGMRGYEGTTFSLLFIYNEAYEPITSIVNNSTNGAIANGNVDIKETYPTAKFYRLACNNNSGFIANITSSLVMEGTVSKNTSEIETIKTDVLENASNISDKADQTDLDIEILAREALSDSFLDIAGGTVNVAISFIEIGGLNVTDGSNLTSTGQKRTGYIPINGASSINYYGVRGYEGATFSLVYLYGEANVPIASIVVNNTSGTIRSGVIDIKNTYPTAKFYRLACNANTSFLNAVTSSLVFLGSSGTNADNIGINTSNIGINTSNISLNSSAINELISIKKRKIYTEDLLDSANVTLLTASTQANVYPAIVNNLPNPLFRGSSPLKQSGTTYPKQFFFSPDVRRFTSYILEFYFTGQIIEIAGRETSYSFTLLVDDVIKVADKTSASAAGYDSQGMTWCKVDLGEVVTNAHIRLSIYNRFGGIATDGTITKLTKTRPKMIVEGDSVFESTAGNVSTSAPNIFGGFGVASYLLNCDLYDAAIGGSGFVSLGNAGEPNILNRFEEYIAPYDCDIFLIGGGLNDGYINFSQTAIDNVIAYALKVYNQYKNTTTKVIWVSPFQPLNATKEESLGINSIRDKAKEMCLLYNWGFIDIIDGITYDEIGNTIQDSSSTLGGIWDGRKTDMSFDGTHPNRIGYRYLGFRAASEIYRLLK